MAQGPLLLSSSSYLLPTLRLERHETPQSLARKLSLDEQNTTNDSTKPPDWCCPIILDVSALAPDGSPHFQPPPPGSLTEMVRILQHHGMQVTGMTSLSNMSSRVAEEAAQMGLPHVWAPRTSGTDPKFDVSQVLQLVRARNEEEQSRHPPKVEEIDLKEESPAPAIMNNKQEHGEICEIDEDDKIDLDHTNEKDVTFKEDTPQSSSTTTVDSATSASAPPPVPIEFSSSSTLYHGSVRSGQQVMSSKGQSLVILGSVNSGGEVLSSGDIFVFGKLRGRAFAGLGAMNDKDPKKRHGAEEDEEDVTTSARIVATSFDAELVAIADVFATIDRVEDLAADTKLKAGQPIMVTLARTNELKKQSLKFAPVNL